jgi:hypothetical protein
LGCGGDKLPNCALHTTSTDAQDANKPCSDLDPPDETSP